MRRKWVVPMVSIVLALGLAWFFLIRPETRRWTEDVALDDGTTIAIERYVEFDSSNSLAGDAYSASLRKVRLGFTGALKNLPDWRELLTPLVLYRDLAADEWVIVAKTSNCDVWGARGKPNPPYWEFRIRGDQWSETPLSAGSIGRVSNLFYSYSQVLPFKHLGLEEKKKFLSDPRVGETYRSVLPPQDFFCADDLRLRNE